MGRHREHWLVVGGTGMLRGATERLLRDNAGVTLLARGTDAFGGLVAHPAARTGRLRCVPVDYRDAADLERALVDSAGNDTPPGRALTWIHGDAPPALRAVAAALESDGEAPMLWDVISSADRPIAEVAARHRECLDGLGVDYRQVLLGHHPGPPPRWLTDEEISRGVANAIRSGVTRHEVGSIRPWPSHRGPSHRGPSHRGPFHRGPSHQGLSHQGLSHQGLSHQGPSHQGLSG